MSSLSLAEYRFPRGLNGALATFTLEMVPGYDRVIRRVAEAWRRAGASSCSA